MISIRRDMPLVVAGAGSVGLVLAVEAVRRGMAVRICDPRDGPARAEQSRNLGLLPTSVAILRASGIADRLLSEGQALRSVDIRWNGKPAATIPLDAADSPTPFILMLAEHRVERALIDWLGERGVEIEWGTALSGFRDTHRPTAALSTGEEIAAYAICGCDGPQSIVRQSLDLPMVGEDCPSSVALADIRLADPINAERAWIDWTDDGPMAFLPLGSRDARSIGINDAPERLLERWTGIGSVKRTVRFRLSLRHAERMARGMIFLAGDAAHDHSPIGVQGINLGIQDAAWLAFLLSEERASEYEMRRLPSVKAVIRRTKAAIELVVKPARWLGPLVEFALPVAVRFPPTASRIADRILALDLPQPEWLPRPKGLENSRVG